MSLNASSSQSMLFIIQVVAWLTCCCFYLCDITGISSSNILKGIELLQDDFCNETPIASEFAGVFSKIRNSILVQALLVYLCSIYVGHHYFFVKLVDGLH